MDYTSQFDSIAHCLVYGGEKYIPVICKRNEVFEDDSIWIMYAREGVNSFLRRKVLFHVKAGSLQAGLGMFVCLYDQMCVEKSILEGEWRGAAPYELDFEKELGVTKV